ncbi:MAG: tRNA pseudouridine(38-40) synthase TruA [Magnetococcales bacterium]|nr:tRNA pseudouridine(38-40) synthase TruA [Magnetococcales bacterium]
MTEGFHRYRLILEYDGGLFSGWQRQPGLASVQQALEDALAPLCGHPTPVIGAGRTDAGVHALGQCAHFDTLAPRAPEVWVRALNALSPRGLTVLEAREVDPSFHARFSARRREYLYRYFDRRQPPALDRGRVWGVGRPLDEAAMAAALPPLLGTHDFSAFRAASCQAAHPVRTVETLEVVRQDHEVRLRVAANAFLHHMVRNLAGSLARVGLRERPPEWLGELLAARDRTRAAATAPPQGLYLTRVWYEGE